MLCERCGQEPATSRVTELVRGRAIELEVCPGCRDTLALLEGGDAFRCAKCGTEVSDALLLGMVQAIRAKRGTFDEAAWNELIETAACPVCGESLRLPRIPWALFADPSSAIPLSLLSRRRPRPPNPGPDPSAS